MYPVFNIRNNIKKLNHCLETMAEVEVQNSDDSEKSEKKASKQNQNDNTNKKTLLQRFLFVLSQMTIEPMIIVYNIGFYMNKYPEDQMILYKICKETESDDFCNNIEDYTNTTQYDDVEANVTSFNNVIALAEHFVPILLAFYIGSWSDHFGRKPFLALCMFGKVMGSMFNFLNAVYLKEWNRWVWVSTVMPIQNICGGDLAWTMLTFAFISDNTTIRYCDNLSFSSVFYLVFIGRERVDWLFLLCSSKLLNLWPYHLVLGCLILVVTSV